MIVTGGVAFIFIPGLCLGVWSTDLYVDCDWGCGLQTYIWTLTGVWRADLYLDCDWGCGLQIYIWTLTGGEVMLRALRCQLTY